MRLTTLLGTVLIGICAGIRVSGYQVPLSDKDDTRQFCSGMYGGSNAKINGQYLLYPWGSWLAETLAASWQSPLSRVRVARSL